jgi:putative glutamine amidotransferase
MSLTIGITHCDEWANYESWIKGFDSTIKVIGLKVGETKIEELKHYDGIILSGGEDVHPSYYNKPEYIEQFKLSDFNKERDEFEFSILQKVSKSNIPFLGICRGLQITNVFFKGTLIPDLPSNGKMGHGDKKDTVHAVQLFKDNKMYALIGEEKGIINSHHHQAADSIGEGLKVTAFSEDGVVEGIEKADANNAQFFALVQWHPERMDTSNPFSSRLREVFIKACNMNL